jgi:hypothetical protein
MQSCKNEGSDLIRFRSLMSQIGLFFFATFSNLGKKMIFFDQISIF